MSSTSNPRVQLIDSDGDPLDNGDGKLNVTLSASDDIEIGNVDIQLNGTAVSGGANDVDAGTLRVTLAGNDTLTNLMVNDLDTIAGDTAEITGYFSQSGVPYAQIKGIIPIVTRNDDLTNLHVGVADGDYTELQVDSVGGLYVTGSEIEDEPVQSEPLLIGGRYDSSARDLDPGDAGAIALSASGHVLTAISDGTEVANVTANNELEVSINNIDGMAGNISTFNARAVNCNNTKVTVADSTTEIVDTFSSRFELTIVNDSDEVIYLGLGEDAVLNEGVRLNPNGGSFSTDQFIGAVDGICASGSKNVTVLEVYA